jgi:sterol desaturase/sphingolipid hydroxylase (fatty acid hydroxylase superfamily)
MMSAHQLAWHAMSFTIDVVRLSIWLILLAAIFVPLERLFALHPAKILRKQIGVDLFWYFINSLLPAAIIAVPLSILATALHGSNPWGLYAAVALWPIWVKLPLMFVINDIGTYWAHRAAHTIPFLWRFHAVHHSAEHIDWLVNTRLHPIDSVFTRLVGLTPLYLLGLAQTTNGAVMDPYVALVFIVGIIWSFFIHANVRVRLGPLEWLISSPAFHHWHHTNDEHRDHNFAAIFPWIDKLFGTAWLPKHWPPVYGTDTKVAPTIIGQLLTSEHSVKGRSNLPQTSATTTPAKTEPSSNDQLSAS